MNRHIPALDSLRGMAALSVVFLHAVTAYFSFEQIERSGVVGWLMTRTPLVILISGHEAVILFFTLSGFVLALPYFSGRAQSYRVFAMRRICRIYLPYVAALYIALTVRAIVGFDHVAGTLDWFSAYWMMPVNPEMIAGYLMMSGFQHHMNINPVVWSLVHEMRISLVLPGLIWLATVLPAYIRFPVFLALSVMCAVIAVPLHATGLELTTLQMTARSFLDTGACVWFFIVGIEMARHRELLSRYVPAKLAAPVLALALLVYCIRYEIPSFADSIAADFVVAIGAAGFIWLALCAPKIGRALNIPLALMIGRCSYSLYLIHVVVLLTMIHGLGLVLPWWAIVVPFPLVAMACALVMWRLVEVPSIQLGRWLGHVLPEHELSDLPRLGRAERPFRDH